MDLHHLESRDGGAPRRITDGGRVNNWFGAWSHDGRLIGLSSNRRDPAAMDAWLYDPAAGELRLVAENPGIGGLTDLSRDGRRAGIWRMASRSSNNLYVRELETGVEHLLTPHEGPGSFGGGVFSPDGRWLLTVDEEDHTYIVDTDALHACATINDAGLLSVQLLNTTKVPVVYSLQIADRFAESQPSTSRSIADAIDLPESTVARRSESSIGSGLDMVG